jgi:uncharacterized membrane protein
MLRLEPILIAIHVVTILLWIGGVAFVTIIIFPLLQTMESSFEQVLMFQRVEHRFARHVRYYLAISGITGFWLLGLEHSFCRLFTWKGIGITMMLFAWAFYLFVLLVEKRLFKKLFDKPGEFDAKRVFRGLGLFHWVILGISLAAVFLGVWQGHGTH